MASGDYLDLAEWSARSARFSTTTASADLALAKQAVNTAYLSTCSSGDPFDFLSQEGQWETVAGSDVYTLASIATAMSVAATATIAEITAIANDEDGDWISGSSWEDLERFSHSTQDDPTGGPFRFSKWNDRIRLYPTPDDAYTLGAKVRLTPANMTADADVPLMPIAWRHRLLVPYAAAILLRTEGGLETASEAERLMQRYDDDFVKFRTAYATAKRPTFNVASPGWDASDGTRTGSAYGAGW